MKFIYCGMWEAILLTEGDTREEDDVLFFFLIKVNNGSEGADEHMKEHPYKENFTDNNSLYFIQFLTSMLII